MRESEFEGMQADAKEGSAAIDRVSSDRYSAEFSVNADLVGAAGEWFRNEFVDAAE